MRKGSGHRVPLPAQLSTEDFTIAAIDNFDHEDNSSTSGKKANHDTVTVLFQNVSAANVQKRKEKVSEFSVPPLDMNLVDKLECQKLQNYS